MLNRLPLVIALSLASAGICLAQNANTNTPPQQQTRKRTSTTTTTTQQGKTTTAAQGEQQKAGTQTRARRQGSKGAANGASDPTSKGVLAAFNSLLDGIRHASVDEVTGAYWNSPQLVLFNYNGTVTRGWKQLRDNRASSYPNVKDVKLEVHDLRIQMLGSAGALATCLWTQSQTYKGTPETATGRMTIVFRRVGNTWKATHLHTSPDTPEPTKLPASEQTNTPPQKPGSAP
ncbi:MAG TPA: nuclear transport factor 2 family protein [Pyrinomonadaceae bacterium]|jgi:ketosteroid isomerase-like protein